MKKMSVADAAEFFGVSREAIHNRIRRGSLQSVVEDGVKMVIVDEKTKKTAQQQTKRAQKTNSSNDERYYKLLESQNAKLQERIEKLENETRSLREQKEQMLIEERNKIEAIYKEKDEQLKNILHTLSTKFMLGAPLESEEPEALEAEISVEEEVASEIVSLKKYLKTQEFSKKKQEKIKKRFEKAAKKDDERVIVIGKKFYLDILKYDYHDLVK
jgi:predicted site-specific integrase-resolvase